MTIASMTGFGAASATDGGEELSVEVKSVNGKFCEVKARLPRELAANEGDAVKLVKERLARGNVDVSVRRSSPGSVAAPRVNPVALATLARSLEAAAREAGLSGSVSLSDLLHVPGIVSLEEQPPDVVAAGRALAVALALAVERLVEVRQREGAALEADLRLRVGLLRGHARQIGQLVPRSVDGYRERLRARVRELAPDLALDPARLEQEVILFADRTDVTEELVRLSAHLDEFDRLLDRPGPVGRSLEFLLQELNREVNTTGSKSQAPEISRLVVELKTELERLREQVQNVE